MIYQLVTTVIAPGKMQEYAEIAAKELVPLFKMKLVASWRGYTGNVNEFYTLFAANDLAEYQKTREAQAQTKDYQRVSAKLNALRISQTTTLLEANAWSPMK